LALRQYYYESIEAKQYLACIVHAGEILFIFKHLFPHRCDCETSHAQRSGTDRGPSAPFKRSMNTAFDLDLAASDRALYLGGMYFVE